MDYSFNVGRQPVDFREVYRRSRFKQAFEYMLHSRVSFKLNVVPNIPLANVMFFAFPQDAGERSFYDAVFHQYL